MCRMEDLVLKKSKNPVFASAQDVVDACDFAEEFCAELAEHKARLTGTKEETATARLIRDRLHAETDANVRLEAYKSRPLSGRGSAILLAGWYALCLVLYLLSFACDGIGGIIITLVSLVLFIAGVVVFGALFFGMGGRLEKLLPVKVSYNVVSERCPSVCEKGKERTLIIAAGHDNVYGARVTDFDKLRKVVIAVVPISLAMFVLFAVLRMAIGIDTVAKTTSFIVICGFSSATGIAMLATFYSRSPKYVRDNGGMATSVALATFAYFAENPHLLPDDVRLVFASFGGENSAHGGSRAFVNAHPEFENAQVITIGEVVGGDFTIPENDGFRNIKTSENVRSALVRSAELQNISVVVKRNSTIKDKIGCFHGFVSNAFSKSNVSSATVFAKDFDASAEVVRREDIERLFSLSVTAASLLMEDDFGAKQT